MPSGLKKRVALLGDCVENCLGFCNAVAKSVGHLLAVRQAQTVGPR